MSTNLLGVWKSADKREPNRHIYVTEVRGSYAYGYQCSANGMRLPKAKPTRVLVAYHGRSLARYRRPDAAS